MKANLTEAGRIAISRQGHDKGCWYCVIAVDEKGYLLCCDGRLRTLEKPKKKQIKHLVSLPLKIDLEAKGGSGGAFDNSDLRKALKEYRAQYEALTEWPKACQAKVRKVMQEEECALVQK